MFLGVSLERGETIRDREKTHRFFIGRRLRD